jgi:hypothetical protein
MVGTFVAAALCIAVPALGSTMSGVGGTTFYTEGDPDTITFWGCDFTEHGTVKVYTSTTSATDCEAGSGSTLQATVTAGGEGEAGKWCAGAISGSFSIGCPDEVTYWICGYDEDTSTWSMMHSMGPSPEGCVG